MKAFPLALTALISLSACTTDPTGNNRSAAEANEAREMAEADNGATPSGPAPPEDGDSGGTDNGDEGSQAAPPVRDEPIKGPPSTPAGPPRADEANQCGASRYRWLIGRPRSAIPPQPANARWRVTCTGCPITMDYSPRRLNIFYDAETERVEEVRCG